MGLLDRFRIGPKIVGIVLLLLLLTALVGGSGLFYLNQMHTRLNEIVDRSAAKIQEATVLSRDLIEVVRAEKNTILAPDNAERQRYIQTTTNLLNTIADRRTTLGTLADAEGHDLLARFDEHWQAYVVLNRQVRELAVAGNQAEAIAVSAGPARDAVTLATADMDALVAKVEADMATVRQANAAGYVQARSLVLGFTGLALALGLIAGLVVARSISSNLGVMVHAAGRIAQGDVAQDVDVASRDETGELAAAFRNMIAYLEDMTGVATRVANGDLELEVTPRSEQDTLGLAVRQMVADLRQVTHENEQRIWQAGGQAGLSTQMRGELAVPQLARNVVTYLCRYLEAPIGALYLDDGDGLKLVGSYAYTRRKDLSDHFRPGEGLVGQAALEQQAIQVSRVPDDYIRVQSGLGEATPRHVVVLPFHYEDLVSGVLELGSFDEPDETQMAFLRSVLDSVAVAFHVARSRAHTLELLQQTQQQAEELQTQTEELETQQEELRQINDELEEQARVLKESEQKLQTQHEELEVTNEELEVTNEELSEKTRLLEQQRAAVEQQNLDLQAAQAELERRAGDLAMASKYKSEFLSNMSHELRTPLNSMLILARMLAENETGNLSEEQVESVRVIYDSGQDLLALINDILDLAKVEAGRMERHLSAVPLAAMVEELARDFAPVAREKGLDFESHLAAGVPAEIHTDRQRLVQILRNLLSNAFKFTPRGRVSLTVEHPRAGAVAFRVTDTGIGIAPEHHRRIFEAFQQVDGSTSRAYGGTGLGLSICREMAAFLGGKIDLESEPGQGSTFTLVLPLTPAAEPGVDEPPAEPETADPLPAPRVADDRDNLTEGDRVLLVVEDDAPFARTLANFAREKGFKALVATRGTMGLALARRYEPTAIVLDLKLPDSSGWDVLTALKDDPDTRHIPVHIISVFKETLDAYRRGAMGYVTKPAEPADLDRAFGAIEAFLERPLKTLLIVEDDAATRQALVKLMGGANVGGASVGGASPGAGDVDTVGAGTAGEALEILQSQPVDCMILDLRLPDMSGFELLDRLEKDGSIAKPPVIVYTGQELTREENERLARYVDTVIVKGVRSEERLLDEAALFLHRVVADLPDGQQRIIRNLHGGDSLFEGKKILLVDDDVRNAFALSRLLTEKGLNVEIATDGQKALDLLAAQPDVDLVLMDVMLPVMDGLEAMRCIRDQAHYQRLPILALTAKAMKGDRELCLAAGANDYLAKPVDVDRLFSMLRVWLYR